MASTVWKGYITFGLISIPIRLFAAARSQHVSFHQVHAVCNTRIKQQLYCPTCERVVDRSEIVKGYEVDKTHIVQITDEEVKKVEPRSTDTMEITEFESSFYSVPEDPERRHTISCARRWRSRGMRRWRKWECTGGNTSW